MKNQEGGLCALEGFALLEAATGNLDTSAHLWGACDTLHQRLNIPREHLEQKRYETSINRLRQSLTKNFERLFQEGQAMSLEQASRLVLNPYSGSQPDTTKPAPSKTAISAKQGET